MIYVLLGIVLAFILLVMYSALVVSSRISRLEESEDEEV